MEIGRRSFINLFAELVKGTAVVTTSVKKGVSVENTATMVGNLVSVTRHAWEDGIAQANSTGPRPPRTTASKIDLFIATTKKKSIAAKAAYLAAASK